MGNKTIYVKDEALWKRAKSLAGTDGLSALVSDALSAYVEQKERDRQGTKTYRLAVSAVVDGDFVVGYRERIAFEGRLIAEAQFVHKVGSEKTVTAYRTKGGKLVLVVDEVPDAGMIRYAVYTSLSELRQDKVFEEVSEVERGQFFDALTDQLGEDWAVWID